MANEIELMSVSSATLWTTGEDYRIAEGHRVAQAIAVYTSRAGMSARS